METIGATKKPMSKWVAYPLIAFGFIMGLPIILVCLPILLVVMIVYWIISPSEKRKFRNSGYDKYYFEYEWGITKTAHYKIYSILKEKDIPFEYEVFNDKDFDKQVIFILEKSNEYNFIMCCEFSNLYYCNDKKDWACDNAFEYEHGDVDELKTIYPFEVLSIIGKNKYQNTAKNYYVIFSKQYLEHCKIKGHEKDMLQQDKRFIGWKDVLSLTGK